jgi:hypothetical protein
LRTGQARCAAWYEWRGVGKRGPQSLDAPACATRDEARDDGEVDALIEKSSKEVFSPDVEGQQAVEAICE